MSVRKVLVFNDTSRYQHYGCDLVMESVFANLRARGLNPVSVHRVGTSVDKRFDNIMRRHPDAAAIVVNGEGVIHHDRKHALGLASIARKAQQRSLQAHLINAALFSNSAALYDDLQHYRSVYVRDSQSQGEALANGLKTELVPDLSFDSIARRPAAVVARSGALITDSVDEQTTAELRRIASDLHAGWVPMRRRVALPFKLLRELGARRFVRRVAAADRVLTGRFHTVTVSIATATPFLALSSNTPKIEAVLRDVFGDTQRMLASTADAAAALRSARTPFDSAETRAIAQYLTQGRNSTQRMFDAIALSIR